MEQLKKWGRGIRHFFWKWFLKPALYLFLGLVAIGTVATVGLLIVLYFRGTFSFPDFSKLDDPRQASFIYDEEGEVLRAYCSYCRKVIPLKDMGKFTEYATAAEDHNFWKWWRKKNAFDVIGIIRAAYRNAKALDSKEGASGIWEQTARNVFLEEKMREQRKSDSEFVKWERKIRQTYIAALLPYHMTRERILEIYLNTSHCAHGLYGVSICSWYYFNKQPPELNTAEYALAVGLLRKPGASPFLNPIEAKRLRSRVLQQFVDEKLISEEEKAQGDEYPLPEKRSDDPRNPAKHFTELTRLEIISDGQLVDRGLKVHTTLSRKLQKVANASLERAFAKIFEINPEATDLRGIAILAGLNGAIKVFAQMPSFEESQYRIDQIQRPLGSTAKPFAILAALEKGLRLRCDDEGDGPCKLDDSRGAKDGPSALAIPMGDGKWKRIWNFPSNEARYLGPITPMEALSKSHNTAMMSMVLGVKNSQAPQIITKEDFIRTLVQFKIRLKTMNLEEGRRKGMLIRPELAQELEIPENTVDPGLTAIIGSVDVSPLDLLRAWLGFLGGLVDPYTIELVEDAEGNIIRNPPQNDPKNEPRNVLTDEKKQLQLIRGLRGTIELPRATGRRASWLLPEAERQLDFQVIGKTGTANSVFLIDDQEVSRTTDVWFVGCTPSYCGVVWIGREKRLPLMPSHLEGQAVGQISGGSTALPIWIDIMKVLYESQPKEFFPESTDPFKPFKYEQKPPPPSEQPIADTPNLTEGDDF